MNDIDPQDVQSLIQVFEASDWTELHIRNAGFELHLNKDGRARMPTAPALHPASAASASAAPAQAAVSAVVAETPATASDDQAIPPGMKVLRAPNLGTFYRSPKPGAPVYVEIGQHVEADTDVCLIEVMKLFTPVKAGMAGIVRKVLVSDTELVEFDQPLFLIEPVNP